MKILMLMVIAIISYLIGSISSAIIIGRIMGGDDIRSHGSGNAGATNALRTYGKMAAVYVTLSDCTKAAISCIIAILVSKFSPLGVENTKLAIYSAGIGVALGHNFPIFFKFKGGKGILVSITALFFSDWRIALAVFIIAILVMIITRYVSLGSVLGATLFIVFALIFKLDEPAYVVSTLFLAILAIYRHKANIKRLLNGTESKVTDKK